MHLYSNFSIFSLSDNTQKEPIVRLQESKSMLLGVLFPWCLNFDYVSVSYRAVPYPSRTVFCDFTPSCEICSASRLQIRVFFPRTCSKAFSFFSVLLSSSFLFLPDRFNGQIALLSSSYQRLLTLPLQHLVRFVLVYIRHFSTFAQHCYFALVKMKSILMLLLFLDRRAA